VLTEHLPLNPSLPTRIAPHSGQGKAACAMLGFRSTAGWQTASCSSPGQGSAAVSPGKRLLLHKADQRSRFVLHASAVQMGVTVLICPFHCNTLGRAGAVLGDDGKDCLVPGRLRLGTLVLWSSCRAVLCCAGMVSRVTWCLTAII
jgi:hypothetical protein